MGVELPTTEFSDIPDELWLELEADAHEDPERPGAMVQLLDEEGRFRSDSRLAESIASLSKDSLRGMYRDMAMIRRFDAEATALQRQGQLALWVPLRGQEAAQIGSAHATRPEDYVFPTYREHGVALVRGVDLAELLRLFRGISNGGWDPRGTGFHLYTMVLAAQVPHAVGYAMGMQRDAARAASGAAASTAPAAGASAPGTAGAPAGAETGAVVAYFGDGASSEGDVHESMVFASSFKAPVVFFCQNNQWAISVPTKVQSRIPLFNRARGYGFPGVRVDGNDVLAVHAVTQWALARARSGKGPVLIEAYTYRLGAHTTADDPTKYRLSDEEKAWAARDPLARFEKYLRAEGIADDAFFHQVASAGDELATKARADVLEFASPTIEDAFAHVYAEPHPLVAEELEWQRQYEAGFTDQDQDPDGTTQEGAR
ncbi:pyruvate dehydrogenase E1 component alpha subunit [Sinomonas cellulolyticus]|uniref:Pyruvate dehydrogenase (Acetyl-transferring) E1 component subunit alpha n=1 Tax=Sinomonas cellulolyticus TaxID=2801916 RepID=A0ABS1K6F7_9MICC|nr:MULTISPECIES: pyruvate dehydrogenase (acetyl-transferring) E1 component subunit alpha [Sinomonas]MBL0707271.1 pyruvate dehydrogenase (acetyl-transferring) E1 component subunit alpha [Sinomonas cellulolyticus]GHG50356.1 pyruvate dehydrogenase E1 component alpha subunit [Sinomonas sp. KCTC 49339]